MIKSGMAVVYWPVGETCGICCHKHNVQPSFTLFYTVHMQLSDSINYIPKQIHLYLYTCDELLLAFND